MSAVVFMGVAGCGKSSVAQDVAARFGWALVEGDEFHPEANLAKMRAGTPLTDADRIGWLDTLGAQLAVQAQAGRNVALTCSSLKRAYRERLRAQSPGLRFVFLDIDAGTALARVTARAGEHLFPPSLVGSQFAALERPEGEPGVLRLDATQSRAELLRLTADWLGSTPPDHPA